MVHLFGSKETEIQVLGFLCSKNFQLVGIFDIHHLVTNVIGSFYEIHQRVPAEPQGLSFFAFLLDAKFLGYFWKAASSLVKKPNFCLLPASWEEKGYFTMEASVE